MACSLLGAACSKSDTTGSGSTDAKGDTAKPAENALEPEETPKDGGKIVIAVTAETDGWNPGQNQWADAGPIVGGAVLEPLMVFDGKGDVKPFLAESMEPTKAGDFTSWTIKLKKGVKFHDNTELNAKQAAFCLDYAHKVSPLNSLAMGDLYDAATPIDDYTVEVKLTQPWASYPTVLAGQPGLMMATSMLESADKGVAHPIGTGPFKFDNWTPDKSFNVSKFSDYWQPGLPHLDAIEFQPITDSQSRLNALKAGNVDMVMTNRAQDVSQAGDEFVIIKDWNAEKSHVILNTLEAPPEDTDKPRNPLKNIHARRALAYATDRDAIINLISFGEKIEKSDVLQVKGTKFEMSEEDAGYYEYNEAKAREEIELYKKDTGYDDFTFSFSGLATDDEILIMQALKEQWAKVGITANITTVEQATYIQQLVFGAFQAGMFRNYSYKDLDNELVFHSKGTAKGLGTLSINFTQYTTDEMEEALEVGRTDPDPATRKEAYETLTKEINKGAINIWLFNTPYSLIAQPQLRGLNTARTEGFGNFLPKPWLLPNLWKKT